MAFQTLRVFFLADVHVTASLLSRIIYDWRQSYINTNVVQTGAAIDFFRRSKYCLEISKARERLNRSTRIKISEFLYKITYDFRKLC